MVCLGLTHCSKCLTPLRDDLSCPHCEWEEKIREIIPVKVSPETIEELRQVREEMNKEEIKCKYCEEGYGISNTNRRELGIELHSGTGYLVAYGLDKYGWDISVECKINYCPMCGKKFKEDK